MESGSKWHQVMIVPGEEVPLMGAQLSCRRRAAAAAAT